MLVNVFVFVPNILIGERFRGAVLALPLAVVIGTAFIFIFTSSINKFLGKGLPEILDDTSKWLRFFFLNFFALMWFLAGCISLLAFNNVTIRFVNPDISGINMIIIFALFIVLILIHIKTDRLLYALEIILVINIPFIAIIIYQAYFHDYISWNSIWEVGTHLYELPSLNALSAATFVFSGYTNLVIFHREFKEKINKKWLWFVPVIGVFNLFTTFFIPIGFWGADGVGEITFPWVSTADTLRIELGPIERVVTFFIYLYIGVSMISVAIHWHVAIELIKSTVKISSEKKKKIFHWSVLGAFFLTVLLLEQTLGERNILNIGELWLNIRFIGEIFLVLSVYLLARRKRI